ncbi:MAG: hypothetical protein HY426_00110 [Candidatus Levybacteria bacterium]|nr:hypothetical protein [Candidatus Levybacteria bacterium]
MNTKLPVEKKKEKFNKADFAKLAKKVREIFEKEAEYIEKEKRNGTNNSPRANFLS